MSFLGFQKNIGIAGSTEGGLLAIFGNNTTGVNVLTGAQTQTWTHICTKIDDDNTYYSRIKI